MKKVITAFTLCFMIAGINSEVEALRSIGRGISRGVKSVGRKVGDFAKGRKTNDATKSLDFVIEKIRGIGSDLISSGTNQYDYIRKNSANTESDLSFLVAYASFAEDAGKFFSYFETMLTGIRTEYATLLGAETKPNQGNKVDLSKINMQTYTDRLMSNDFEIHKANLHSSSIILLSYMQQQNGVPKANLSAIKRLIDTVNNKLKEKKLTWKELENELLENFDQGLSAACKKSGYERSESFERREELWIKQISLIKTILVKLSGYIQEEDKSGIEDILKQMDYYSGDRDTIDEEYAEGPWRSVARQNARRAAGVPDRYAEIHNDEETEDGDWYYSEY